MPTLSRIPGFLVSAFLLCAAAVVHAATPLVLDNTSPDFSTTGTWPASTTVTGYQGSNYQTHEANGSPPGAIIVDNTDAGFSVTGNWPGSTSVGGYLGSNYQVHSANGEEPTAIVVDNLAGSFTGTWGASTSVGGYYGTNYQAQAAGSGANSFTWTPTIATTGAYKVYARWTMHPNRSTQATYTVNHAGGSTAVTVNQEANGGTWQLLGTFTLNSGTGNTVVLVDQGDGYVIADAIKFTPDGAAPNTATWTPTIPTAGPYKVYARWTAHPNRATDAQYTVTHAGGDTLVTVDQEQNNGSWVLLGTFSMAPGSGHKVSVTDQANGYVIADAIRLLDAASPEFNTATWAPNAPAGQYEVYAKWTASANRATNATYTITHAQGVTQVPVDQQLNGGAFNLLGTFNLNGTSTITLTDQANGYVIADAIQLIALTTVPKMYFVHTDHLNTPRLITSDTGQAVWQWANDDPYGNNAPNENPSGAGNFTCNLRLPGQYFDVELNTHYNYFRDYDPVIGRYIESDPIGLASGINTYAYVLSNPLSFVDPTGLQFIFPSGSTIGGGLPSAGGVLAPGSGIKPSRPGDDPFGQISTPGKPTWPFPSSGADAEGDTGASAGRRAPPGKCTPTQHRILQDEVDASCKIPRRCDPSQGCDQLLDNYYKNIRCAQARDEINNTCFAGGDAGHRQAANDARNAANRCIATLQQKGCANCPVPPNK